MTIEIRWIEKGKLKKKRFTSIREALVFRAKLKEEGKDVK